MAVSDPIAVGKPRPLDSQELPFGGAMETLALAFEETSQRRDDIDRLLWQAFPDMNGDFYGPTNPWMLVLGEKGGEVIAHLAVYIRRVLIDEVPTEIGLLGGVAIAACSRGNGFLRPLIEEAHQLLRQRGLGRVDKVDSQIGFAVIQDCFLGGGFGARRFVGRGVAAH